MPAYMIVTAAIADRDAFIAGYGQAAAKLVAASRHHAAATEAPAAENGAEPAAEQPSEQ